MVNEMRSRSDLFLDDFEAAAGERCLELELQYITQRIGMQTTGEAAVHHPADRTAEHG